jgi:hypothetical protein
MTCPNCGYKIPYQPINQRIAEWAADKHGFDPKDFVEINFSPFARWGVRGVNVSIHYWKDGDYKVEELGHYENSLPSIITDMYEYKRAMEQAREMSK